MLIIIQDSTGGLIRIDVTWPSSGAIDESWVYRHLIEIVFGLCLWRHALDSATSTALLNLEFHLVRCIWKSLGFYNIDLSLERLRKNVILSSVSLPIFVEVVVADSERISKQDRPTSIQSGYLLEQAGRRILV